jgi:hypothetical protein
MSPMLTSNFQSFCLSLPSARITGMHHHTWFHYLLISNIIYEQCFPFLWGGGFHDPSPVTLKLQIVAKPLWTMSSLVLTYTNSVPFHLN